MKDRAGKWVRLAIAATWIAVVCLPGRVFAQGPILSVQPTKTVQPLAGTGTRGYSGDLAAATSANLALPSAVAYDSAGNLYIADTSNNVIREVDTTGKISTVAGNGVEGFGGDGGPATSASLDTPTGVAVDKNNNLYIADSHNQRIRVVSNGVINTFAGNGTAGFSGDGGAATQASLFLPAAVAVDSSGNVYIADTDNNRIRKVSGGTIATVAGDGEQIYAGDNGPATAAGLDSPTGVAVDGAGNIYIADSHNHVIRKVDTTGNITTIAGNGTLGFSGDGGSATQATLADPSGLAVDAQGNIYITDSRNNVIREISNGVISTIAGSGAEAFSSSSVPASSAVFDTPSGLSLNASGDIAVADRLNQIVAAVNLPVLTFSNQAVGTISSGQSITVSNTGTAALQVQSIDITSGFQIASGGTCSSLPISLSAGSSCTLQVAFVPGMVGATSGSITLNGASVTPQTLLLNGTGTQGTGTLQVSGATSTVYGSGTLTATLSSGVQTATGTITFSEGSTVLAAVAMTNDSASLDLSTLPAGTHTITASYSGDANYGAATSSPFTVTVTQLQLTATAANVTSIYGQAIPTLTGTLSGVLPQDAGKVSAVFSTAANSTSPVGTYPIAVSLSGSAAGNYTVQLASTGAGVVTIIQAGTAVVLTVDKATIDVKSKATFTAVVSSQTSGIPTGSVNFYDGTTLLGNGAVDPTGVATYTATFTSAGKHTITAVYSGDPNYTSSTSAAVVETVLPPNFTITAEPSLLTLWQGQTGIIKITVTPTGGYTGSITFNCASLPAYASCVFTPPTITLDGSNTPQSTTLAFYTSNGSGIASNHGPGPLGGSPVYASFLWLPLGFVFASGIVGRKRLRTGTRRFLILAAICAGGLLSMSGCGGHSVSYSPTGTNTVTVQAVGTASASGSANVTQTVSIQITITNGR